MTDKTTSNKTHNHMTDPHLTHMDLRELHDELHRIPVQDKESNIKCFIPVILENSEPLVESESQEDKCLREENFEVYKYVMIYRGMVEDRKNKEKYKSVCKGKCNGGCIISIHPISSLFQSIPRRTRVTRHTNTPVDYHTTPESV